MAAIALQRLLAAARGGQDGTTSRLRQPVVGRGTFEPLGLIDGKCAGVTGIEQDQALARGYRGKPALPLVLRNSLGLDLGIDDLLAELAINREILRDEKIATIY